MNGEFLNSLINNVRPSATHKTNETSTKNTKQKILTMVVAVDKSIPIDENISRLKKFEFTDLNHKKDSVSDALKVILQHFMLTNVPNKVEYALAFPKNEEDDEWDLGDVSPFYTGSFADFSTTWVDAQLPLHILDGTELFLRRVNKFDRFPSHSVTVLIPRLSSQITISFNFTTTVKQAIDQLDKLFDGDDMNDWMLFLPLAKKNDKHIGLWLSEDRVLQSYLISPTSSVEFKSIEVETNLVFCKEKSDVSLLSGGEVKFFEHLSIRWWINRLINNKWPNFHPRSNKKKFEKLKRFVRKGIPFCIKGEIWTVLTGSRDLVVPNLYDELKDTPLDGITSISINKDIYRTFPEQPLYNTKMGIKKLRNVLIAYANYEPEIGYCQGMNFIVATLLLVMNEENAFWTFHALVKNYGMFGFFDRDISLLGSALLQFENCVKIAYPPIIAHFLKIYLQFSMFASGWFHTLFSSVDAMNFLFRLWDIFFNEGWIIIFKVAHIFLEQLKEPILKSQDPSEIINKLKLYPKTIRDFNSLLSSTDQIPSNIFMYRIYSSEELIEIYVSDGDCKYNSKNNDGIVGMYLSKNKDSPMVIDLLSPRRKPSLTSKKSSRKLNQKSSETNSLENALPEVTNRSDISPDISYEASCEISLETPQEICEDVHEVFRKLSEVQSSTITSPSHQDDTPLESNPEQSEIESPTKTNSLIISDTTQADHKSTLPEEFQEKGAIQSNVCSICLIPVTTKFCAGCGRAASKNNSNNNSNNNNNLGPVREKPEKFANLLEKEIWEEEERQRKHAEERKRIEADLERLLNVNSIISVQPTPSSTSLLPRSVSGYLPTKNIVANTPSKIKPMESERAREIREQMNKKVRDAKQSTQQVGTNNQRKVFINYYT